MANVLHPELFRTIPFVGNHLIRTFEDKAQVAANKSCVAEGISIVIRTLNESAQLEELVDDIQQQEYAGDVEIIVVDNESSDSTPAVARRAGATLVNLAREAFSYPRSMNLGMEAASHDLVWLTVGHALPTTTQLLQGGALSFAKTDNAGAFSTPMLPNANGSLTERVSGISSPFAVHAPKNVTKAELGTMAATSAMLRKDIWKELGAFDERYETGGEDTAMAAKMLEAGYTLTREPLLSVHHSHGLGLVGNINQLRGWIDTVRGPGQIDRQKLIRSRPHLRFN